MSGWLLDTNVLSALLPGKAPIEPRASGWFERHTNELYVSSITVAEICTGVEKLRRAGATARGAAMEEWLDTILSLYADRIALFDVAAARVAGTIADAAIAAGRHPGFPDVAIAAIAQSRDLTLLTRNLRHFEPMGVSVFDPFADG